MRRSAFMITWLVICCGFSTGCDQVMGDLLKHPTEESNNPEREAFSNAFKQLKSECPLSINELLTLEKVRLKDLDEIEFRYRVTEAGRKAVQNSTRRPLREIIAAKLLPSPITDSILELDLKTSHTLKDTEGAVLLSLELSPQDLLRARNQMEKGTDALRQAEEELERALNPIIESANNQEAAPENQLARSGPSQEKPLVANDSVEAGSIKVQRDSAVEDDSTQESVVEQPWRIEQIKANSARTTDNPAGVRSNPFAN